MVLELKPSEPSFCNDGARFLFVLGIWQPERRSGGQPMNGQGFRDEYRREGHRPTHQPTLQPIISSCETTCHCFSFDPSFGVGLDLLRLVIGLVLDRYGMHGLLCWKDPGAKISRGGNGRRESQDLAVQLREG